MTIRNAMPVHDACAVPPRVLRSFLRRLGAVIATQALGLLLGANAVAAGTFYVDAAHPQASDSGPGTASQPYRTVSAAVSARGGPGTTILVAPSVYREQITVGASGSAASPFVIRAMGPGVIVDGAESFASTAQWAFSSGSIWYASAVAWSPKQVMVDGVRLAASSEPTSSLPANSFRYVSGSGLYVNAGGGNPGGRQTFVGRRSYGFRLSGKSYVTIEGFAVTRTEDRAIYLSSSSNQCTVSGNSVTFAYRYGIQLSGSTGGRVTGNIVTDHLDHGIYLSSSTTGALVDGNECARNSRAGGSAAHGIALSAAASNRIERNRLHHNSGSGVQIYSSSSNGVSVQNRSWSNGAHGYQVSGSTGVRCVCDVAWANTKRGFTFEGKSTGGSVSNAIAANNGVTTGDYDLYVESGATAGFVSNDNVIWDSTAKALVRYGATTFATLSAFTTATGNDSRSIQADPRFAAASSGDFHLGAGSPAIDAANSEASQWPATDAENRTRFDDAVTPNTGLGTVSYADRGALEYAPLTTPPVAVLSVTPSGGTAPLDVLADASGSFDSDGTVATYEFAFGDGAVVGPQTAPTASHRYGVGAWTVRLTVTDNLGATASDQAAVVVSPGNQPPQASLILVPGAFEGFRDVITDPSAVFLTPARARPAYLSPGADPTFGTTLTRIGGDAGTAFSGPSVLGTWGSDARHHYSKDEPWNSDGTLIAIENSGTPGHLLLDGEQYGVVAGECSNYDYGDDRWHPSLPHVRINAKDAELSWFDVVDCVELRSWTLPFPVDFFGPGEGNTTRDGRFAALTDGQRMFVVDMDPQPPLAPYPDPRIGPVYDFSNCGLADCTLGWVSISASGKYVVVKYNLDHPRVFDVDPLTLTLTPRPMPASSPRCAGDPAQGFVYDLAHADLTLDPFDQDEDVLIGQEHCGWTGQTVGGQLIGGAVMVRLRDGAVTALTDPTNESHVHHVSARNTLRPGWAYLSYRPEPGKRFSDEVVAVKLDGSKEVQRLAHKHGLISSYRAEAHAVPSPDGRRVMFASNWALDCVSCPPDSAIAGYVAVARATVAAGDTAFRQTVRVDASGSSDPDGGIVSYRFAFGDGAEVGPQSWPVSSHTFRAGTWPVKVVVTDGQGAADSTTTLFTVRPPNRAPDGAIDLPAADVSLTQGDSVAFAGTGTDPDGDVPLAFAWSFGGGAVNRSEEDPGPVRFDNVGTFVVTLTVTDALGLADPTPDTVRVTVVASPADQIHWTIIGPGAVTFDWHGSGNVIYFGLSSQYGDSVVAAAPTPMPPSTPGPYREARITGLAENTLYHYSIGGGSDHTFRTALPRGQSGFTVFAQADVGPTSSYPNVAGVQSLVAAGAPAFCLVAGDLTYANAKGFPSIERHFNDVMVWSQDAAYMPAWGNHEYSLPDLLANYKGRFDLPNAHTSATAPDNGAGEDWSWFDYGNARFISFPEPYGSGAWTEWASFVTPLMDSAQADPTLNAIVTFGHRPAYSSGEYTPGYLNLRAILDTLGAHHSKYVLDIAGHSHDYERSWPQFGVIHMTVGTGGSTLETVGGSCPWRGGCPAPSWSAFRAMHHGPLELRFESDRIVGQMRCGPASSRDDIACVFGTVIDSFTIVLEPIGVPVDRAPVVNAPASATVLANALVTIPVTASDADGDPIDSLTVDLSSLPAGNNATFQVNTANTAGTFSWTPTFLDERPSPYVVTFRAHNRQLGTATTAISVSNEDRAPIVVSPSAASGTEGQPLSVQIAASDPDEDAIASLSANLAALPSGATFTPNVTNTAGTFQWTPGPNDGRPAPYVAIFTATNARFGVDTTSITIGDATPNNLVGNPSFEASMTNWNGNGGATLSRASGGYDGVWACKVQGPASTADFGLNDSPNWLPSVTGGTRYRFSAWVKAAVGAGGARFKVREYYSGTQVGATAYSTTLTLSSNWQYLTVDFVAQQTGSTLDMQVLDQPSAASESFFVDFVAIVIVAPASPAQTVSMTKEDDREEAHGQVGAGARSGDGSPPPAAFIPHLAGSVRVTPHPVAGSSLLRFAVPRAGAIDVRLYDSGGREVRSLLRVERAAEGWFEVPIASRDPRGRTLPAGVYFYRIRSADGEAHGRIVVLN